VGAVAEVEVVAANPACFAVDQLGRGLDLDSVGKAGSRGDKIELGFVERQAHMKPSSDQFLRYQQFAPSTGSPQF